MAFLKAFIQVLALSVLCLVNVAWSEDHSPRKLMEEISQGDLSVQEVETRAKQGDAEYQYLLAFVYAQGLDKEQSYTTAAQWLKKSSDQGFAAATHQLGMMYLEGVGVPKNRDTALRLMQTDLTPSMIEDGGYRHMIGLHYTLDFFGMMDYEKAFKWFKEAEAHGAKGSLLFLGIMYLEGAGVEQDDAKAFEYLTKSAQLGNETAQYYLDRMRDESNNNMY